MKTRVYQKGFLAIIAVVVVAVLAIVCTAAVYQFTSDSRSGADQQSSVKALFVARSGIDDAIHRVATNGTSCQAFSLNNTLSGVGDYGVTGSRNFATTTLNGIHTASQTTINLTSSAGFASYGAAHIQNEIVYYRGISGNSLTGVTRGVSGTTPIMHASGTTVAQNQCLLQSTGYVPNTANAKGKRMLIAILEGTEFGLNTGTGIVAPAVASIGPVLMKGNSSVTNPDVTASDPNVLGSTIVSASTISLQGSAQTNLGTPSVKSSDKNTPGPDLQTNNTSINASNLFSSYFDATKSAVQAAADQTYNSTTIMGPPTVTNKTIWMNGNQSFSSNGTIGSATAPVILIINGTLDIGGNVTIYGLVYTINTLTVTGTANIYGAVTSEGSVSVQTGNANITHDQSILNMINTTNGTLNINYNSVPPLLTESFP